MSNDAARAVKCGECGSQTRVTPSEKDDDREVEPWTPFSDRVKSALIDIRYNAHQLREHYDRDIGATLHELADKIERHYRVIDDDRRERVYEATNRILEYAQGESDEAFYEVEEQVDTILSTVGVPDRVVNE